jgi:sugar lactone lactonase YvrE
MSVVSISCIALLAVSGSALGLEPFSTFGSSGEGPGQISQPSGIAIGPDGSAYLADSGNNRIDVFSAEGVFIRSIGKEAIPSECDKEHCQNDERGVAGVLSNPKDVVLDSAGNLFVADYGNNRIDVFSAEGIFIRAFGKGVNPSGGDVCTEATQCQKGSGGSSAGTLASPTGIGIDAAGKLYVAGANFRIDVFSPEGAFVRSLGKEVSSSVFECKESVTCQSDEEAEAAGAMNVPYDVAIDASGRVAVSDYKNFRIDVFTSAGDFIHAFGKEVNPSGGDVCTASTGCRKGAESAMAGGLAFPSAVAVDGSGSLYVADTRNNRINEFSFDGTFIRAFGEGVINGASAFQVCSTATGCSTGIPSGSLNSVSSPRGTAVDCAGGIYAVELISESKLEPSFSRVERFGESGTPNPPCAPSSPSPSPPAPPSVSTLTAFPPPPSAGGERPATAKPTIQVELNKGSGTAILIVTVSDPGSLAVQGKDIFPAKRRAKRSGLVELLVVPKRAVKRKLKATHKATVKLSVSFAADNGASDVQTKVVTLKLARRL